MTALAPLFAARNDWVPIAVLILFVVIPAIAQLVAKIRQQRKPAAGQPQAGPAQQPAGGKLEDEIGDFLRRAVRRQGAPDQARQAGAEPHNPVEPPVEAEIVPAGPVGGQVQKHVGEYLDAGKFDRRASELGDEAAHSDERMGQRLGQVFEHEVGRLAGTLGESADAPGVAKATQPEDRAAEFPSTAAAGLFALLSNAQGIRQAIVINEILQRPEDRWT